MFDFDSVSHLNGYIKQSLQDNPYLAEFTVTGEISQYIVSARDHAYFSIKDDQSVINCVIFSRNRSMLKIEPSIGMKVKVTGGLDFYTAGGKLQKRKLSRRQSRRSDRKRMDAETLVQ